MCLIGGELSCVYTLQSFLASPMNRKSHGLTEIFYRFYAINISMSFPWLSLMLFYYQWYFFCALHHAFIYLIYIISLVGGHRNCFGKIEEFNWIWVHGGTGEDIMDDMNFYTPLSTTTTIVVVGFLFFLITMMPCLVGVINLLTLIWYYSSKICATYNLMYYKTNVSVM